MANNSNLSKRAALRQQQEQEDRRKRAQRMMWVGLGVVGVIVVVIVAIVLSQVFKSRVTAEQINPPNATDGKGIRINSVGTQPVEGAPHVVVYEDYQCPGCASYETTYGPAFTQLVDEGKITMEVRTATFLNEVNKQSGMNKESSTRAARAAAAADVVGKYREYHEVVYKNQPKHEGTGYTDQQLRVDFPAQAGITGDALTQFQTLYDTGAMNTFTDAAAKAMYENGVSETPTYTVEGKKIVFADKDSKQVLIEPNAESVLKGIETAKNS